MIAVRLSMRIALSTLTVFAWLCAAGMAQDAKKKDDKAQKPAEVTEVAGHDLKHWVGEIASKDPSKRELAMRMVLGFGPEKAQQAVPAVVAELKKHNKPVPIDLSVRVSGAVALG